MARRKDVSDGRDRRAAAGRVFGYARVSGAEQAAHGTSLEAQQSEIRRYCKYHRLPAPKLFVEVESAAREKLERRVELARLLAETKPGDTILVTKLDRWSRDVPHAVQSVRDLLARGVRWVSIGENLDASGPHSSLMLNMLAMGAEFERERIKERLVGTRKTLRDQGQYVEGRRPFGYKRGSDRHLVIDPEEAAVVRELFERVAGEESLSRVARSLALEFGFKRDKSVLHRMLRNRVYLGEVANAAGEQIEAHKAIVTPRLWARATKALIGRRLNGRPPSAAARTATWLLRGCAKCALCDRRMGAAYRPVRSGEYLDYYICCGKLAGTGCKARYVRVDRTDEGVAAQAVERLREIREELGRPASSPSKRHDTAAARVRVEQRRERLVDLAESGDITKATLRQRLERLELELEALDRADADEAAKQAAKSPAARRELLRDVKELERMWNVAPIERRREIVKRLAERIDLHADRAPSITWRSVEMLLADSSRQ